MTRRGFDGVVPQPGEPGERDRQLLATVDGHLAEEARLLEAVELRRALKEALAAAQATNGYLNAMEPWRTAKEDRVRTATTLWTAIQAISGIAVAFAPFTPFSSERIRGWLGGDGDLVAAGWARREVPAGTPIGEPTPLFAKIELAG